MIFLKRIRFSQKGECDDFEFFEKNEAKKNDARKS